MPSIQEQRAAIDQSLRDMFATTNKAAVAPRGHEVVRDIPDIQTQQINAMGQARNELARSGPVGSRGLPQFKPERPR
jgi:hypothetical protein